jgi:hypothetical protein
MGARDRAILPKPRTAKLKPPFKTGSLVELKNCPGTGRVTGMRRGKVLVHWVAADYLGAHRPSTLVQVEE